ncbi:MAG: Phosphoserine phosphatase 1 [Firmicutes bacterium ADurb.Bin248]|nr:MAG: Phosphoserine phosphatase 1 [Firmicutes bacterium ADurb.Bin248]HOG00336.1 histidine phosphatase family protein [Clostridia bacterium]HPK16413.1 histidine phosphatase family protein [Clostridia bacterium]
MKLFLIRHGETEWNALRRVQGRTDIPLNKRGVLQAEAAADYLRHEGISAVYSAPLSRARDTAGRIAGASGAGCVRVLEGLTEINFGGWEGKTDRELMEQFPEHWGDWNWVLDPQLCRGIGAESAEEILSRSLASLEVIRRENPEGTSVAVVSHTMPIKLVAAHFIGMPVSRIRGMLLYNCAASALIFYRDGDVSLERWNDASYLRGLL